MNRKSEDLSENNAVSSLADNAVLPSKPRLHGKEGSGNVYSRSK
jgi:hypothetical protein